METNSSLPPNKDQKVTLEVTRDEAVMIAKAITHLGYALLQDPNIFDTRESDDYLALRRKLQKEYGL